ncbi:hypothetical protein BV20DRAFT_630736 [Pilatotrama ljubarskyi]|nr:hypothetical protein BV20DRAFT_630736 [Pilatotrama ljubarskyi]
MTVSSRARLSSASGGWLLPAGLSMQLSLSEDVGDTLASSSVVAVLASPPAGKSAHAAHSIAISFAASYLCRSDDLRTAFRANGIVRSTHDACLYIVHA